jgi:hypothetical protein
VASEWAAQVAGVVGGKGEGKVGWNAATSVGIGTDVSKVEEGVAVAVKYLEKLEILRGDGSGTVL